MDTWHADGCRGKESLRVTQGAALSLSVPWTALLKNVKPCPFKKCNAFSLYFSESLLKINKSVHDRNMSV